MNTEFCNLLIAGGRGQTHRQYDAIRRLMSYTYLRQNIAKKKGWRRRKFVGSRISYPSPLCSKTISNFADLKCKESGLTGFGPGVAGAQFSADKIVCKLVSVLKVRPSHVHIQVCGDGFRAMHSTSIVNVGVRLLIETEQEAGDTSYTSIATL